MCLICMRWGFPADAHTHTHTRTYTHRLYVYARGCRGLRPPSTHFARTRRRRRRVAAAADMTLAVRARVEQQ